MFSIFKRNRDQVNRNQTDALLGSAQLDEAVWDEIEETLISADVSVPL